MISLFHIPSQELFDSPYKGKAAKAINFIDPYEEPFTVSPDETKIVAKQSIQPSQALPTSALSGEPASRLIKFPSLKLSAALQSAEETPQFNNIQPHHQITHLEKLKLMFKPLLEASYKSKEEAEDIGKQFGLEFDNDLSIDDTYVYNDMETGFPLVTHRGSVTTIDWLVSDILILTGMRHIIMPRIAAAQEVVKKVEAKYKQVSDGFGHSLGGVTVEHSGAGGYILTYNKAAGFGDIKKKTNGRRQIDYRNRADIVSLLAETQDTRIKYIENNKGLLYSHGLNILPTVQERRL